jgi:hypothetical protein
MIVWGGTSDTNPFEHGREKLRTGRSTNTHSDYKSNPHFDTNTYIEIDAIARPRPTPPPRPAP